MDGSQSEEWVITPPDSPKLNSFVPELFEFEDTLSPKDYNRLLELPNIKFHCLGHSNALDNNFHKNSIYEKIYKNDFEVLKNLYVEDNAEIQLFNRKYLFWSVLKTNSDELFNLCRKEYMKLYSCALSENFKIIQTNTNSIDFTSIRDHITLFLNFIYIFVVCCCNSHDKTNTFNEILPNLKRNLNNLWLLFTRLGILSVPDYVLAHYASFQGDKNGQTTFQLIHCILDTRWLLIKTYQLLQRHESLTNTSTASQIISSTDDMSRTKLNEKFDFLMSELVSVALCKFDRVENMDISCFNCVCVREFWLLIGLEMNTDEEKNFWSLYNKTLSIVLHSSENQQEQKIETDCRVVTSLSYFRCARRPQFCLYLLANVSKLLRNSDGANFEHLEDIVKVFLNDDPAESDIRQFLPLLLNLLRHWKCYARHEPVLLLWEFYQKRLNCAFYVPGSKLDSCAVNSKTGHSLLEQVKRRLSNSQDAAGENSYSMFLKILGNHMLKCKENGVSCQKITSRLLIKLTPNKMADLTEFGLYHVTSLLLTVAFATDVGTMVSKLQSLLIHYPADKLTPARLAVLWKSHVAAVLLCLERDVISDNNLACVIGVVDRLVSSSSESVSVFTDGLKLILGHDRLSLAHLSQLTGCLVKLSRVLDPGDVAKLMSVVLLTVQKLRKTLQSSTVDNVTVKELTRQLTVELLPGVDVSESLSAAELSAEYTLLYQASSSVVELNSTYNKWTNVEDVRVTRRYVCYLLNNGLGVENDIHDFETTLVQVWIKCWIFSPDDNPTELQQLTRTVYQLEQLRRMRNDTSDIPLDSDTDCLLEFILTFKHLYNHCQTLQEKSSLRDKFLTYISKLERHVTLELKSVDTHQCCPAVVNKMYKYIGVMFSECYGLIYVRSHVRSFVKIMTDTLLLPAPVFKHDHSVPQTILDSIKNNICLYVNGLFNLGPQTDPFINRTLRDIIVHYTPRLSNVVSGTNCRITHPLIDCFTDVTRTSFILQILVNHFLSLRGKAAHSSSAKVISLLSELVDTCEEHVYEVVLQLSVPVLLDFIMLCEETGPVKQRAVNLLTSVVRSPYFESEKRRGSFISMLESSCRKHLSFKSLPWLKLALLLTSICPQQVEAVLPTLQSEIENVERKRCLERDIGLRRSLEHLEKVLQKPR